MRNLRLLQIGFLLAVSFMASTLSAKDVEVKGESTFYDDGRHSKLECMRIAAEQARVDALARAFGTTVTQNIIQSDRISKGKEVNDLLALSMTEVRGEWIADIGEPSYNVSLDESGNFVVTCSLKGKAREISNETIAFDTGVLKNSVSRGNESTMFNNGDQMYLYFNGASDGYLMVFLEDESKKVYNILPYPMDTKREVKVKANQEYTFFHPESGKGKFGPEEELILTADDYPEYNKIYVVFSPNSYSAPVMKGNGVLPEIASTDFTNWLLKSRRADPKMGVKTINLEILPGK